MRSYSDDLYNYASVVLSSTRFNIPSLPPSVGLTGILFSTQSDSAYSVLRIWLAIGFTLGFIIAELLDLHSKVWLMLGAVVVALSCALAIELLTRFNLSCTRRSYSVNRVSADCDTSDTVLNTLQVIMAKNPLP